MLCLFVSVQLKHGAEVQESWKRVLPSVLNGVDPRCAQHVGLSWEPSRDAVLPDDCVDAKVGHEKSLEMVR